MIEVLNSINILGFIDARQFFIILHLLGFAIGMGSAISSDWMFMASIKDKVISHKEASFLQIASRFVWIGLGLLFISGLFLVFLNPDRFLDSHKFWAKQTIIGIILLNGLVFHFSHIPRILKHRGQHLLSSDEFKRKNVFLYVSGALSIVSWVSAFLLGSLGKVSYSYFEIMGVYVSLLVIAIGISFYVRSLMFNKDYN